MTSANRIFSNPQKKSLINPTEKNTMDSEQADFTTIEFYGLDDETNVDLTKYRFVKRTPLRETTPKKNEIFVAHHSNSVVVIKKAQKILVDNPSVVLHGLGAAMNKTISIGQSLVASSGGNLTLSANTSTVPLIDDYEPLTDDVEPFSQVRYNSAIHLVIAKRDYKPPADQDMPNAS